MSATTVLLFLVVLYLTFILLVWAFQSRLVYFPAKQWDALPHQIGLPSESLELTSRDNVKISAWFVPCHQAKATILFCHGNAGNISHRLESIRLFHELGLAVLIFDYRGYGKSQGRPSEKGTYLDAQAAWDYLTTTRKLEPNGIVILGRSLGGAVAAHLAAQVQPQALILESSFTSIPELGRQLYPFLPIRLIARINYNTIKTIKNVKCPIMVIHSRDDEIISYQHGRKLFEAASRPKRFLELRGGHNEGFLLSERIYRKGLMDFVMDLFQTALPDTQSHSDG